MFNAKKCTKVFHIRWHVISNCSTPERKQGNNSLLKWGLTPQFVPYGAGIRSWHLIPESLKVLGYPEDCVAASPAAPPSFSSLSLNQHHSLNLVLGSSQHLHGHCFCSSRHLLQLVYLHRGRCAAPTISSSSLDAPATALAASSFSCRCTV